MTIFFLLIIIPTIVSCWSFHSSNKIYEHDVALIYYNPDELTNLRCSGLLISPNIILTAAHCFENNQSPESLINPKHVEVYLGLPVVNNYYLGKGKQKVKKVILHENYHFTYSEFDIGIIVLQKSVSNFCNKNHYLIEPKFDIVNIGGKFRLKSFPKYDKCFFLGWGSPNISIENNKLNKKKIKKLMMRDDINAQRAFRQTMLLNNVVNSNDAPCNGDSGGPIICQKIVGHKSHNYIVGVVSEASSVAPPNASPEEFCEKTDMMLGSSVGLHRNWLNDKINSFKDTILC